MESEALHSLLLHAAVGLEELGLREAVFRLLGLADDGVAALERTGVPTAAEAIREMAAQRALEEIEVGDVVEVDDRAERGRFLELGGRRVVRREHHVFPDVSDGLCENQLRHRRTVAAETFLSEQRHEVRVGRGLDGEVLVEALVPGKGGFETARVRDDRRLVVDVERRGPARGNGLKLFTRKREFFHSLTFLGRRHADTSRRRGNRPSPKRPCPSSNTCRAFPSAGRWRRRGRRGAGTRAS